MSGEVAVTYSAIVDEAGTLVRQYKGGVKVDEYYIRDDDGDWRDTIPAGHTVTVHDNRR